MKLIEALKKTKDLQRKAADIRQKVAEYCADRDCEAPVYPNQREQISIWLQSFGDIVKEIGRLRSCIQKTNMLTEVTITLGNKNVTKTISEWINRRKDLADLDASVWKALSDKGIKEVQKFTDTPSFQVKRRLYYDPVERDNKLEMYRSEPHLIDSTLEVINATTELVEI